MAAPILMVMPHLGFGGAERVASRIAGDLRASGHEIFILVLTERGDEDSTAEWFAPVATVLRRSKQLSLQENVGDALDRTGAAILVAIGRTDLYEALPALRRRGPHLRIVSFQFNEIELTAEHRRYIPFIDTIIVEGAVVARMLMAQGISEQQVAVISSGIDLAHFGERRRWWPRFGRLRVGFVGRMDPIKGTLIFVALCDALRHRPFHFIMAGEGLFTAETRAAIGAAGLADRIDWRGRVSQEALPALYHELDVLIAPSTSDGRPLVVQEAQAAGVAVIASRVGSIPSLIEDGVTGLLCPPGDLAGLIAALESLASDRRRLAQLGKAGRRAVHGGGGLARSLAGYRRAILG